jgi:hypothetical protein
MRKIQKFEEFDPTNEGLRSSISIIGMLIGLGIGNPETLLANQEKIERSIDFEEEQVLHLLDSLERENTGDTIFGKKFPIGHLTDAVEKYCYSNFKVNLKLDDVIKTMQQPSFPVRIDLFFVNLGKQIPITTFEYQHNDKITFMFTKNDVWDKNLLGLRINL